MVRKVGVKMKDLELVVGDLYYHKELLDNGYKLARFHSSFSMFHKNNVLYHFKHIPLKKLKLRFKYVDKKPNILDDVFYTVYDKEAESDLFNCCSKYRLM